MKFQRIISLILALSIIFSLGISAFAEDIFAAYTSQYQAALAQAQAQAEETQREYERMLRDLFNLEEAYKHYIRLSSDREREAYLNSLPVEHQALLQEYIDRKALETTVEEAYQTAVNEAVNDTLNDLGEEDLEQFESIYQVYIDCYETYGPYADLSALNPLEQELVRNYVDRKKAPAEEQPATTETAEEPETDDAAEDKPEEAEPKPNETTIPEDPVISPAAVEQQIIPETEDASSIEDEEANPDEENEEDQPEEKGFLGGFMDFLFRGKSPARETREKQKTLTEEEESSDNDDGEKQEEEDSPKDPEDNKIEEEKPVTLKKGNAPLASPSSNDVKISEATYSIAIGSPLTVTVSNIDSWAYGCRVGVWKGTYIGTDLIAVKELNSDGTVSFGDMSFEDGQYCVEVGVYLNEEHNRWTSGSLSQAAWQIVTISGNKVIGFDSHTPFQASQTIYSCPSSITVGQPLTVTVSNLDSWAKGCLVTVWKGAYISSDLVSMQELETNGTVTFSETLFEQGDYSVSVSVYLNDEHTNSTPAATGENGYRNFTVSGSRVAAPSITTTKETYSLNENFYFSIKLAKKGAEKIEWQTVLTQTDGTTNYFGSDVITDIPANGIVSNITTRSPHIGTVTISATAYYNGVASETGTKTITIKNQNASVLKFTKPTTNKIYDNEDLVIAWTSITNADMYTLQIKQGNNYLTGGGTYYNNNPVTVPKNEVTAGTPIEISVVAQYSDGKTLTYSDGSPVQAVMTLNVLSSAPNEIPDFEVSVPSTVPFGSPVTVTWTAPVWAENPNWSPSEYVIYWMRVTPEGIEDLYQPISVKKGEPLTATLPGDYTLMQTDNDSSKCYQVSVYAVGEKRADNNPPPQKASDGVFNVSSPFTSASIRKKGDTSFVKDQFIITAITEGHITSISDNTGKELKANGAWSSSPNTDGTITWSREYTAEEAVTNRCWTLTAYIGEKVVGTANTEKLDINAITLNLTASPTSTKVGEKVKFTVSCNKPSGIVTVYAKDDYTGNEPVFFDEPINLAADNRTIEQAFSTAGTRKIFAKLTDANTGAELKEVHIQIEIKQKPSQSVIPVQQPSSSTSEETVSFPSTPSGADRPQVYRPCNHVWGASEEKADKDGIITLWHRCIICGAEEMTDDYVSQNVDGTKTTRTYDDGYLIYEIVESIEDGSVYKTETSYIRDEFHRIIEEKMFTSRDNKITDNVNTKYVYVFDDDIFPDGEKFRIVDGILRDIPRLRITSNEVSSDLFKYVQKFENEDPLLRSIYHKDAMKKLEKAIKTNPVFDEEEFSKSDNSTKKKIITEIVHLIEEIFSTEVKEIVFDQSGREKSSAAQYNVTTDILTIFKPLEEIKLDELVPTIAHELRHSVQNDIKDTDKLMEYFGGLDRGTAEKYQETISKNVGKIYNHYPNEYYRLKDYQQKEIEKIFNDYRRKYQNQISDDMWNSKDTSNIKNTYGDSFKEYIEEYQYLTQPIEVDAFLTQFEVEKMFKPNTNSLD